MISKSGKLALLVCMLLTLNCVPSVAVVPDRRFPVKLAEDVKVQAVIEKEDGTVTKGKVQFRAGDYCADRVVVEGSDGGNP
jgi:hypothetical protein